MNAFEILGLTAGAKACEIKRAYKSLALLHHPDKPSGDQRRFQGISEAFAECMKRAGVPPKCVGVDDNTDVRVIRITIQEMFQGGVRDVQIPVTREVCRACLGTGARDPADFISCLGCSGTGSTSPGVTCLSCGGIGGCNVSISRCRVCDGRRYSSQRTDQVATVNVIIPPGVLDGAELHCSECHVKVSHQDLCVPVALKGHPGCSVSVRRVGETSVVSLTVTVTLGEMMCGFCRRIMMFGETIDLRQTVYDPSIAVPMHVFKTLRSKFGLRVDVHVLVDFPSCSKVAPFQRMLDMMFN